jgi:serine/threonine protein kinase/tetratricopeptide (TPR) repeat protein
MSSSGGQSGSKPTLATTDPALLVGLEIGDFEIIREIGRGGMGTVFQARQKSLDRIVAIKILSTGLGLTPVTILRFQREAQAAARLHHGNIVPIHAQGDSSGLYYYAMEFIRGQSVHDIVSRARRNASVLAAAEAPPTAGAEDPAATVPMEMLPDGSLAVARSWARGAPASPEQFEKIATWTAGVADALEYAHGQGVIHRDIKPHNLIVGDDGRIYVLDFGLARVLAQPGVTTTGEFVGSPLYMSPEQISGGRRKVDKRTDTYSLGATLYEWLTLSPPYPGETREQVISRIITSEPLPPRALNPHLPVDLETICLKALEKNPDRRYQSAADMRDDLRRFAAHQAIRARRAGFAVRARKFVLRNKVASLAAVGLFVAITLSGALVLQARQSRGREKVISATTEQLVQRTAELNETVKAKEVEIADLRAMMQRGADVVDQIKETDPAAAQFFTEMMAGRRKATDALAQRMSKVFVNVLRAREARQLGTHLGPGQGAAYALYLQALASTNPAQAATLVNECLRFEPDYVAAEMLAAAIACGEQDYLLMSAHAAAVIQHQPEAPDGYLLRGTAELLGGDLPASVADLTRALGYGETSSWALALRGVAHVRQAEHAEALHDLDAAVGEAADNVLALVERARLRMLQKDYSTAIADMSRVIELEQENIDAYVLRGDCYSTLGRYAEASDDYTRALNLDPVSLAIGTKAWQAIAKRNMRDGVAADGRTATTADAPPEDDQPSSAPALGSDARTQRKGLDWLERILGRKPPERREGDSSAFQFPLTLRP